MLLHFIVVHLEPARYIIMIMITVCEKWILGGVLAGYFSGFAQLECARPKRDKALKQ